MRLFMLADQKHEYYNNLWKAFNITIKMIHLHYGITRKMAATHIYKKKRIFIDHMVSGMNLEIISYISKLEEYTGKTLVQMIEEVEEDIKAIKRLAELHANSIILTVTKKDQNHKETEEESGI